MKKITITFSLLIASICSLAQVSALLDIHGRLQWDNANGYCGENSIQMIGLYYGNYICEQVTRNVAGGELLLAVNDTQALKKLSFTFAAWNYNLATPQYQNYLVWIKQYLQKRQPVIIAVYIKGMSDPDYDHIIPAIGFSATNLNTYSGTDQLMYNSNYDSTYFTRTFSSIYDTRSMNGNGATYSYCIPANVDYGVAVTGVKDALHVLKPVHLKIDSWDEPNVSLGVAAKTMHAVITVDSLIPGQQYALLRYNNYLNVPGSNFIPQNADVATYFTANSTSQNFNDSFMSDTAVFYRCVKYATPVGIVDPSQEELSVAVYPNPSNGKFTISMGRLPIDGGPFFVTIKDLSGRSVYDQLLSSPNTTVSLPSVSKGIYFVTVHNKNVSRTQKIAIDQ